MSQCRHPELVMARLRKRLQCRRCGLTITAEELGGGPCPECLDSGEHCREFAELPANVGADRGYRCADCGARISWE